jgi:hypothetical protein
VNHVTHAIAGGIRKRFEAAVEKKKHAEGSVEAGREFVAAYVEFVHYVERLHQDALASAHQHEAPQPGTGQHHEAPKPAPHHGAKEGGATEHHVPE